MTAFTDEKDEHLTEMRKKVREAVHENRNLSAQVHAAARTSKAFSSKAQEAAYEAIASIEENREERRRHGPSVPPWE